MDLIVCAELAVPAGLSMLYTSPDLPAVVHTTLLCGLNMLWVLPEVACAAQVTEPIRFLLDLPQLSVVMMGKQEPSSTWMPQSTVFLVDLAVQLKLRHPSKDILRLSALGMALPLP